MMMAAAAAVGNCSGRGQPVTSIEGPGWHSTSSLNLEKSHCSETCQYILITLAALRIKEETLHEKSRSIRGRIPTIKQDAHNGPLKEPICMTAEDASAERLAFL
ncbi:hypothetical protein F2P79_006615 [Pimephales promelas]|nr:hypothetical protein F2P79_006615 [Pimephales promelas]